MYWEMKSSCLIPKICGIIILMFLFIISIFLNPVIEMKEALRF